MSSQITIALNEDQWRQLLHSARWYLTELENGDFGEDSDEDEEDSIYEDIVATQNTINCLETELNRQGIDVD